MGDSSTRGVNTGNHTPRVIPSPLSAALLLGGIISNTQNFQAEVTTERDHTMADWLRSQLELPADFVTHLFAGKSDLAGDKLHERFMGESALFAIGGKRVMISQIEMIGAEELVASRKEELLRELHEQTKLKRADRYFLSLLDVHGYNLFVTDDTASQRLVERVLDVKFTGPVARRKGVIMRKEIVPKLKTYLEHHA